MGASSLLNDTDTAPISSALQVQWAGDWLSSQRHHCHLLGAVLHHRPDPDAGVAQARPDRRAGLQLVLSHQLQQQHGGVSLRGRGHHGVHGLLQLLCLRAPAPPPHVWYLLENFHGSPAAAQADGEQDGTRGTFPLHAAEGSPCSQVFSHHRWAVCSLLASPSHY